MIGVFEMSDLIRIFVMLTATHSATSADTLSRQHFFLPVAVLFAVAVTTSLRADSRSVPCVIRSIDVKARQVTVLASVGHRKDVTLKVDRVATLMLNDENVPLDALELELSTTVIYDSEKKAITEIRQTIAPGKRPYMLRSWTKTYGSTASVQARLESLEINSRTTVILNLRTVDGKTHIEVMDNLTDTDKEYMDRCFEVGNWILGDRTADEWLRAAAGLGDSEVSASSAQYILANNSRLAAPALGRGLAAMEPEVRLAALNLIKKKEFLLDASRFIPPMIEMLKTEENPEIWGVASNYLQAKIRARVSSKEDAAEIVPRLQELAGDERLSGAAMGLMLVVAPSEFIAAKTEESRQDGETAAARAIEAWVAGETFIDKDRTAIVRYGGPVFNKALLDERPEVRRAVLEIVGQFGGQLDLSRLVMTIKQETDVKLWIVGVELLGRIAKQGGLSDEDRAVITQILSEAYADPERYQAASVALLAVDSAAHEKLVPQYNAMYRRYVDKIIKRNQEVIATREKEQLARAQEAQKRSEAAASQQPAPDPEPPPVATADEPMEAHPLLIGLVLVMGFGVIGFAYIFVFHTHLLIPSSSKLGDGD